MNEATCRLAWLCCKETCTQLASFSHRHARTYGQRCLHAARCIPLWFHWPSAWLPLGVAGDAAVGRTEVPDTRRRLRLRVEHDFPLRRAPCIHLMQRVRDALQVRQEISLELFWAQSSGLELPRTGLPSHPVQEAF